MSITARFDARPLGQQATTTREALLDALETELGLTGWREIRVIELARNAGTSPASFYQYFADLSEAYAALLERIAEQKRPQTTHMQLINSLLAHERTMGAF